MRFLKNMIINRYYEMFCWIAPKDQGFLMEKARGKYLNLFHLEAIGEILILKLQRNT